MNTLLYVLLWLVPVLCLLMASIIDEKDPPTYRDIWYGEDR
jgi:hypothetical protein